MNGVSLKLVAVILSACLFLTGCTVSITTTVNPDGLGEVKVIYKLSQDDQQTFTQGGMTDATKLCEGLATMSEGISGQGSIKQEKHGSETWCVMAETFDNLEAMRASLNQQGLSINALNIDKDRFVFDASMDTGNSSSDFDIPIGLTYELTVPGKVLSHNADRVEDYTLIWELEIGQVKQMHAESGVGGRSLDWLALIRRPVVVLPCIGVLILALIVLIIGEVIRGGRQQSSPPRYSSDDLNQDDRK